ncbi:HNH endonuclease [Mameliella alba]|uniref:HNH endonuclease n=1 Tax=Mameliella alba TaxID=561184 RepID=UPI001C94BDA9|nr:HNH endonuclease signature motif containing protein [Mameliella alba]MBY6119818.1 HNH endonuclease [Mameliella alba]
MNRFRGPSRAVTKTRRWEALRLQALRRDDWACVQCGARSGLEVDHIQPVRDTPQRAYDLANLQTLCGRCHSRKTRIECGHPELRPERQAWRDLLCDMTRNLSSNGEQDA